MKLGFTGQGEQDSDEKPEQPNVTGQGKIADPNEKPGLGKRHDWGRWEVDRDYPSMSFWPEQTEECVPTFPHSLKWNLRFLNVTIPPLSVNTCVIHFKFSYPLLVLAHVENDNLVVLSRDSLVQLKEVPTIDT